MTVSAQPVVTHQHGCPTSTRQQSLLHATAQDWHYNFAHNLDHDPFKQQQEGAHIAQAEPKGKLDPTPVLPMWDCCLLTSIKSTSWQGPCGESPRTALQKSPLQLLQ